MKLLWITLFTLGALFLSAHPPSEIQLSSNLEKEEISVTVIHAVGTPTEHYVKEVRISLNGEAIITQKMQKQNSSQSVGLKYRIPGLKEGDKIEVFAECVRVGTLTQEFSIQGE